MKAAVVKLADTSDLKSDAKNSVSVQVRSAALKFPLCKWCKENPVKLAKNETCSISCGRSLYWYRNQPKIALFIKRAQYAKRTFYHKRIEAEFQKACKELNLEPTANQRKFYIRARNIGYLRGHSTASKRMRRMA